MQLKFRCPFCLQSETRRLKTSRWITLVSRATRQINSQLARFVVVLWHLHKSGETATLKIHRDRFYTVLLVGQQIWNMKFRSWFEWRRPPGHPASQRGNPRNECCNRLGAVHTPGQYPILKTHHQYASILISSSPPPAASIAQTYVENNQTQYMAYVGTGCRCCRFGFIRENDAIKTNARRRYASIHRRDRSHPIWEDKNYGTMGIKVDAWITVAPGHVEAEGKPLEADLVAANSGTGTHTLTLTNLRGDQFRPLVMTQHLCWNPGGKWRLANGFYYIPGKLANDDRTVRFMRNINPAQAVATRPHSNSPLSVKDSNISPPLTRHYGMAAGKRRAAHPSDSNRSERRRQLRQWWQRLGSGQHNFYSHTSKARASDWIPSDRQQAHQDIYRHH